MVCCFGAGVSPTKHNSIGNTRKRPLWCEFILPSFFIYRYIIIYCCIRKVFIIRKGNRAPASAPKQTAYKRIKKLASDDKQEKFQDHVLTQQGRCLQKRGDKRRSFTGEWRQTQARIQYKWLEDSSKTQEPWKVIYMASPPYTKKLKTILKQPFLKVVKHSLASEGSPGVA